MDETRGKHQKESQHRLTRFLHRSGVDLDSGTRIFCNQNDSILKRLYITLFYFSFDFFFCFFLTLRERTSRLSLVEANFDSLAPSLPPLPSFSVLPIKSLHQMEAWNPLFVDTRSFSSKSEPRWTDLNLDRFFRFVACDLFVVCKAFSRF